MQFLNDPSALVGFYNDYRTIAICSSPIIVMYYLFSGMITVGGIFVK